MHWKPKPRKATRLGLQEALEVSPVEPSHQLLILQMRPRGLQNQKTKKMAFKTVE